MSNSLDFCKLAAADKTRSRYTDRNFAQADEFGDTKTLMNDVFGGRRDFTISGLDESGRKIVLNIIVDHNPNANFDYFTSEELTHDGTYIFIMQAVIKCIKKIATGATYYRNAGKPEDGAFLHYTIGNAIVLNEYGEQFAPEDRPWMRERTTVLLPIKYEVLPASE